MIPPKMYLLEEHTVPFIQRSGHGFEVYGEQGAESIHPTFNQLKTTYGRMKPNVRRLNTVMTAHLVATHPDVKSLKPPVPRRIRDEE